MDPDTKEFLERGAAVYEGCKSVDAPSQIPSHTHWAIIYFDSKLASGRPAPTGLVEYEAFIDEKVWRTHVELAHQAKRVFRAMAVQPATVTVSVSVAPFEPLKRGGQ